MAPPQRPGQRCHDPHLAEGSGGLGRTGRSASPSAPGCLASEGEPAACRTDPDARNLTVRGEVSLAALSSGREGRGQRGRIAQARVARCEGGNWHLASPTARLVLTLRGMNATGRAHLATTRTPGTPELERWRQVVGVGLASLSLFTVLVPSDRRKSARDKEVPVLSSAGLMSRLTTRDRAWRGVGVREV